MTSTTEQSNNQSNNQSADLSDDEDRPLIETMSDGEDEPLVNRTTPSKTASIDQSMDQSVDESVDESNDDGSESDSSEASHEHVVPVTDARVVTLTMGELNARLTCRLCGGYFRDVYTLQACGHSFCRSCLQDYIDNAQSNRGERPCPEYKSCKTALVTADPLRNEAKFDRALQNLVDKILPHFAQADEQLKRDIAEEHRISQLGNMSNDVSPPDSISRSTSISSTIQQSNNQSTKQPIKQSSHTLLIRLAPHAKSGLPSLTKPIIVAPTRATVRSLRRLIAQLINIKDDSELLLSSDQQLLGLEHNLEFVSRTVWRERSTVQTIEYKRVD